MKRFINNFQSLRPAPKTLAGKLPLSISQSAIHNPRSTIGFTLIEVMIAVAVVTMGIVAVLGLIPVALRSARDAADNAQAATIVQDIFTTVRSTFQTYNTNTPPATSSAPLYNILDGVTLPSTALFDIAGNQTYAAGPDSYYRVDLTYRRQDGLLTLYRVTAAVSWPEHGGAPPVALPANTFITEVVNLH